MEDICFCAAIYESEATLSSDIWINVKIKISLSAWHNTKLIYILMSGLEIVMKFYLMDMSFRYS